MKCTVHTQTDATARCTTCGGGLCAPCAQRFSTPMCETCLLAHNRAVGHEMIRGLSFSLLLFLGMTVFLWQVAIEPQGGPPSAYFAAAFGSLLVSFTYWGWRFVSERWPGLALQNLLMHFLLKLFVAYFIGLFVGPYQIYKSVRELSVVRKTAGQIARGEI